MDSIVQTLISIINFLKSHDTITGMILYITSIISIIILSVILIVQLVILYFRTCTKGVLTDILIEFKKFIAKLFQVLKSIFDIAANFIENIWAVLSSLLYVDREGNADVKPKIKVKIIAIITILTAAEAFLKSRQTTDDSILLDWINTVKAVMLRVVEAIKDVLGALAALGGYPLKNIKDFYTNVAGLWGNFAATASLLIVASLYIFIVLNIIKLVVRTIWQSKDNLFSDIYSQNHNPMVSLIKIFIQNIHDTFARIIPVLFQIFHGYETVRQKNKGLFLAACAASLASTANTYFGLVKFYEGTSRFTAFFITIGVQIAIIITGTKFGEGLREKSLCGKNPRKKDLHTTDAISKKSPLFPLSLIYFSLILISTTFAYNNMFDVCRILSGFNKTVNENVISLSDETLFGELDAMVSKYSENNEKMLDIIYRWEASEGPIHEKTRVKLAKSADDENNDRANGKKVEWTADSRKYAYNSETQGWDAILHGVADVINKDNFEDMAITQTTYTYYYAGQNRYEPSHSRNEISVAFAKLKETLEYGKVIEGADHLNEARNSNYQYLVTTNTFQGADKYFLLDKLFNELVSRINRINSEALVDATGTSNDNAPTLQDDIENFRT